MKITKEIKIDYKDITQNLYKLDFGKSIDIAKDCKMRRVPGGWIYTEFIDGTISNCFVPYNKEFQ